MLDSCWFCVIASLRREHRLQIAAKSRIHVYVHLSSLCTLPVRDARPRVVLVCVPRAQQDPVVVTIRLAGAPLTRPLLTTTQPEKFVFFRNKSKQQHFFSCYAVICHPLSLQLVLLGFNASSL